MFFLIKIEFELFVEESSAAEIGTSRATMNRTGKTRATQGVDKHYNEYKDFHQAEIEAHHMCFIHGDDKSKAHKRLVIFLAYSMEFK